MKGIHGMKKEETILRGGGERRIRNEKEKNKRKIVEYKHLIFKDTC
jgi:hypothetical protein